MGEPKKKGKYNISSLLFFFALVDPHSNAHIGDHVFNMSFDNFPIDGTAEWLQQAWQTRLRIGVAAKQFFESDDLSLPLSIPKREEERGGREGERGGEREALRTSVMGAMMTAEEAIETTKNAQKKLYFF